ncbi:class II myosin [Polyrhizophydium stewartii]|uniref:Class II myosin n=1 Tax=Polyrhizophydium stewartii TaxID=2732419 RepID=A0ABR4N4D4_9FUNG|nr:hypothetical protein HK105_001961 [Polyrhizophydium stewartii]
MASQFLERVKQNIVGDAMAQAQWAEKKWVWVVDKDEGYVQASIVRENGDEVEVMLTDDSKRVVSINDTEKMNPPKFDKVEDMADLTHLNEASVIHNLRLRYFSNLIYTYSGLFCVTVNPYKRLPIYTDEVIKAYKGKKRAEMPPHVYSIADCAYYDMMNNKENQSILITGESGAGKTENTKKVIQYLAAAASVGGPKNLGKLEQQILQANPILESFGNAQTIRNNNSSRFGKFIRIEFSATGHISGGNIDKYLLEKSRVTHQTPKERNYHIFYQFIKGASAEIKQKLLIDGSLSDYRFTKNSNKNIDGVDDAADFKTLKESFMTMGIGEEDQLSLLRVIAAVLHLGNITLESDREGNAGFTASAPAVAEKLCHVMGIPVAEFSRSLLKPRIKAGRDWVTQARNVEQVYYSIEALARSLYERMFSQLVDRINSTLYTPAQKATFIGVLDIAGFEIFEVNTFEQLCINYTNERLQQFFNHHMFILEQEEYKRENIDWKFIDFGLDLQPTIDLIEKTSPIGILSLLDEECVMPKATDKTFIDKLNGLWKGKSAKYEVPRFNMGFILQHYAGKVEYSVTGWLDKNKDPLNDNVTRLLANSSEKYIAELFSDSLGEGDDAAASKPRVTKKGSFRTVAQRHKEGLQSLMSQLYSTQPHFVRCIIPNEEKKPGKLDVKLVLDQLRCNGVLEGIRICRAGFPNRVVFQDFRTRYELLAPGVIPKGFMDGRKAAQLILEHLNLDKNQYRIGSSKVFFRAGVLADLENQRDVQLSKIVVRIQAHVRGYLARKVYKRRIDQLRAIKIIQKNARIYVTLREWSWWRLYTKVKPLLNVSRTDEELKKREELAKEWEEKARKEAEEKAKIEAARLALELEKKRIEELLIQEQNAAVNQAEILARTQKREVDLNDRLKEILAEIEEKDALNESLGTVKKKLELELKELKEKVVTGEVAFDRLDKEKQHREARLKEVEEELRLESERVTKLETDKKSVETQLAELQHALESAGDSQAELLKSKTKLQASLAEVEQRLEQETDEKQRLDQRRAALEQELARAKEALADLERAKAELEQLLKKRDSEIAALGERLAAETAEKDSIDKARRELQLRLNSLTEELETEKSERDKITKLKKKAESEMEQLHQIMQEKGTEENKQVEIRRLREQELTDARNQLAATQAELEETRKRNQIAVEKLNTEIESVRQDLANLTRAKAAADAQLAEVREELEKSEENRGRVEKAKRQAESELEATRFGVAELQNALAEVKAQKETADKQVAVLSARLEESEGNASRLDREKQSLQRQADALREEVEDENKKRQALESQKKKLATEIADMQARLEEEYALKSELQKKLTSKTGEFDALKERYNKDVSTRTAELEEAKRKVEKDLADMQARLEDSERVSGNLDKTRARLVAEIEDLKLEIDREHNTARNAERLMKQVESQLSAANMNLESERRQRDLAESNARKLQSTIDALQLAVEEKTNQIASVQKSKNELESELKALINEIGDGGKNIHELEKAKRRLEARIDELTAQIEDEEAARRRAEEAKSQLEIQFSDYRKKAEGDLVLKEGLVEETRRMLMKEVNSLGEQLDEANKQKGDLLKAKKRLEEQVDDLNSRAENSAKGQSDLQKLKAKNEAVLRELQARLEEEERNRRNFEELSQRHEKKANALQSEIERLETQVDGLERTKKQLEKKVEELDSELNGEESKQSLVDAKRKLLADNQRLQEALEEAQEERAQWEASKAAGANEASQLRSAAYLEYEEKISKLEESRRALLAAQRLASQELEDKTAALATAEKHKKQLQGEIDEIKQRLESEILAKSDESASRRKLAAEVKDLQLRLDAETAKASELADAVALFRLKADQALEKLEAAELGRVKAEKGETTYKQQVKELEDSLNAAIKERRAGEDRVKSLEEQIIDLQEKLEENGHELADLQVAKRRVQEELAQVVERHKLDTVEREGLEDMARKKYQKEVKQLMADLETEKAASIQLKETVRDLEMEVETMTTKLDAELRGTATWKKEKEKLDARVEDLTRAYTEATRLEEDARGQLSALSAQLREARSNLEESDLQRAQLEKAKRSLEARVEELDREFNTTTRARADMQRSVLQLDQQTSELRDMLEEFQEKARTAEERARRAETHTQSLQVDLTKERDLNIELEKAKLALEKTVKEVNSRIFDLETMALSRDSTTAKRLDARVDELMAQLEAEQREKSEAVKAARKSERVIRELQFQLGERDKQKARFDEEQEKLEQKIKKMRAQIEELETSESSLQLAKRRAEREAMDFRERAAKFEKEVEKLKGRMDRGVFTQ